jgi:CRISPR/Cas system-associated exonuclease Cas4 (RecB family)
MAGEPDRPKSYGRKHTVTSVNTYLECPQRYYLRYVKRLKTPDWEVPQAWRFGTCVHAAMEAAYGAVMDGVAPEELPTMLAYRDVAIDGLRAAWTKEDMPTHHGAFDRAVGTVDGALEALPLVARDEVLGVEYCIDGTTPDGALFIGYVDLVLRVSRDTLKVRDWKVTGRRASPEELACDLQLNTYSAMLLTDFPWAKHVVVEHWYPTQALPGGSEPCVTVPSPPAAQAEAVETIESVVEMIEADDQWTPRPGDACESCPFRLHGCPVWEHAQEATEQMAGF